MKPENIIIEANTGRLKLVDFGFAKELPNDRFSQLSGRTFTKCGTPEYMAPEVINQKEFNST